MIFKKLRTKTQVILTIQSISMLGGASTHLLWVINNGFLSEKYNVPFLSMLFWDSLTFLDIIAAILLILKPRAGVWLTTIIIVVDVFHNSILLPFLSSKEFVEVIKLLMEDWMVVCQIGFLLFVLLTFKSNMREINLRICTNTNGNKSKNGSQNTSILV